MNDFNQKLSQLWQAQPTKAVDEKKVRDKYRSQTKKQRLYAFADFLSLVPIVFLWVFFVQDMSTLIIGFMILLTLVSVGFVAYITWLRRIALTGQLESTDNFSQNIVKQLENNCRIAQFTRHGTWVMCVCVCLFTWAVFHEKSLITSRILYATGLCIFTGVAVWIWALKREHRFRRELNAAKSIFKE